MRAHLSCSIAGLSLLAIGSLASAHQTGSEITSAAECAKLQSPMKGHCGECLSRPRPHHFHADLPPAARCQPAAAPTPPSK